MIGVGLPRLTTTAALSAPATTAEDGGVVLGEVATFTGEAADAFTLLGAYTHLFLIAFFVTLFATPIVRRIAVAAGVVDRPDSTRKFHRFPIAYLGGVAVFLGLVAAIAVSFVYFGETPEYFEPVPIAVVIGMFAITLTGLADDAWGWDPRLKIAGQLIAAAALAIEDVGTRVADGALRPILGQPEDVLLTLAGFDLTNEHVFYWVGTALIAAFVLGGCNAANLIDGLDGLLSGVTGVVAMGLLVICLMMASLVDPAQAFAEGSLGGARLVLAIALLGAVLGFLPHNFNPASIFLGDCGSLLLGYMCVVIILMLGEHGQTHLVFAGLIVFAVPIMDTTLAIVRRRLAGQPMSAADDQHIHHQLKRLFGGVKRAVLALYGIAALFAVLGVTLAALVMFTSMRVRIAYAVAAVLFSCIGALAVKGARQRQIQAAIAPASQRPADRSQGLAPPAGASGAASPVPPAPAAHAPAEPAAGPLR